MAIKQMFYLAFTLIILQSCQGQKSDCSQIINKGEFVLPIETICKEMESLKKDGIFLLIHLDDEVHSIVDQSRMFTLLNDDDTSTVGLIVSLGQNQKDFNILYDEQLKGIELTKMRYDFSNFLRHSFKTSIDSDLLLSTIEYIKTHFPTNSHIVTYSNAAAERGRALYHDKCAPCHNYQTQSNQYYPSLQQIAQMDKNVLAQKLKVLQEDSLHKAVISWNNDEELKTLIHFIKTYDGIIH